MKTHYFDVTDIVAYIAAESSISGIQRVSFEVLKRMVERHGADAVKVSFWDGGRRDFLCIPSDFVAEMEEFDHDILSAIFFGSRTRPRQNTPPTLERYRNRPAKYWFHYTRRQYYALRGNEAHFAKLGSSIEQWKAFRAGTPEVEDTAPEPRPGMKTRDIPRTPVTDLAKPGDELVVLGATWAIDGFEDEMLKLKTRYGMRITQMVHDLIPIRTPEHIAGDFAGLFYYWLKTLPGYCDTFLANSANTARDLADFLKEIGVERPIRTVPLAQDFGHLAPPLNSSIEGPDGPWKARAEQSRILRREIQNLAKTPYVLVVGTMESRKNIWRLAQAWDRMRREDGLELPKLVFAGKHGWYNDDFNQMIKGTGNLGGWIQFAIRPTDTELKFLYENCLFTAMVSFYEGWGLPIGESLHFGKTAVVADNSAMPEVGGDMVEYCDAHSLNSIHAACRRLITDPAHREALEARIAATPLRRWEDVTNDIVEILSEGAA